MENQKFGKFTFISILAKLIKNKKILIIDFDFTNNDFHSVLGEEEMKGKVKIDKNIDLISKKDFIVNKEKTLIENKLKEIFNTFSEEYDLIFIDTSDDTKYKNFNKMLANLSNEVICLTHGNLIYLRKTVELLKKTIEKLDVN